MLATQQVSRVLLFSLGHFPVGFLLVFILLCMRNLSFWNCRKALVFDFAFVFF